MVLSQGDKVLGHLKDEKGKGKGWNKWFQALGKIEGKNYFLAQLAEKSQSLIGQFAVAEE